MKPVCTTLFARSHCGGCVLAVPLRTPKPLCVKALRFVSTLLAVFALFLQAAGKAETQSAARRARGALKFFALQNVAARYRMLFPELEGAGLALRACAWCQSLAVTRGDACGHPPVTVPSAPVRHTGRNERAEILVAVLSER
jgi:hypothetical protein